MADDQPRREDFGHFLAIPTRWDDMDAYSHVNNVVFYSYIDTVVTGYLVTHGKHDKDQAADIGLVVESGCKYFRPLAFPDIIDCGLRVGKLGRSSVRYEVGMFAQGSANPAAYGHFVHVFVNRETMRPSAIPANLRAALEPCTGHRY